MIKLLALTAAAVAFFVYKKQPQSVNLTGDAGTPVISPEGGVYGVGNPMVNGGIITRTIVDGSGSQQTQLVSTWHAGSPSVGTSTGGFVQPDYRALRELQQ